MSDLDFGNGFTGRWVKWSPDRLIPENFKRYHDVQDIEKSALLLTCRHGLEGVLHPDAPDVRRVFPNANFWTVESWEPLTLNPSIQTGCCHGYIREGKWVDA
jgi:hypothetical protein